MKLLLIISFSIALSCNAQIYTNFYDFRDNTATTLTDAVGGNNGTLAGTVTAPVWVNKYIRFTGGNGATTGDRGRVAFASATPFNYNSSSIFSIIIMFKSSKSDANIHGVFTYSELTTEVRKISISLTADEYIDFRLDDGVGVKKRAIGTANVCDGNWHLAVMTYSNQTFACYMDGKVVANTTDNVAVGTFYPVTATVPYLGTYKSAATFAYDATADIKLLINCNGTALTSAQVQDLTSFYLGNY